jgi:hypothetical protein
MKEEEKFSMTVKLAIALVSVLTALIGGYFTIYPKLADDRSLKDNALLKSTIKKIELQQELDKLRNQELDSVQPSFQVWVDHMDFYNVPAWVKVKDFKKGRWEFLAVNRSYVEYYGIPHNVRGRVGSEVYSERKLNEDQLVCIAQYEVNDYKAVNVRPGLCIQFLECSLPKDRPDVIEEEYFVKCPVAIGTRIAVIGHMRIGNKRIDGKPPNSK